MDKKSKRARQRTWLEAYKAALFNVTKACEAVCMNRSSYYKWLENDPDFAKALQEAMEERIDFVENKLLERIADGDTTAIIFALKTLAKHRGYVERQEIVGPVNSTLPAIDIKILLQNPQIRLALENISNELSDGSKDIKCIR